MLRCSEEDRTILEDWARSRTLEARLVERAGMVLQCLEGKAASAVARALKVRPNTVIGWRRRFEREGIAGLYDRPRSGKPRRYREAFRNQVLATVKLPPPPGQARWDGHAVAKHLHSSVHAVWRVLRHEGIWLSRQRSWCVSTDPEFATKVAEIVGLYLNPPDNALVLSVDEKPSIPALERATDCVETDSGKIVRSLKSTYKRHGTLNLCAALEVATKAIRTHTAQKKRRIELLEFMDHLVSGLSLSREMHVILDRYCIHAKNTAWLAAHPNVYFYFTPTSASWLNQVEVWFRILSCKALRGASFRNLEHLRHAIEEFVASYGPTAKPFIWRKREIKSSQLKNTIVNLRN